jgi:predicted protein tyrosine phosphatase
MQNQQEPARARKTVNEHDIQWADLIFVMENKHKKRLTAEFAHLICDKPIYVLDIPDEYHYMDPLLRQELEATVSVYFDAEIASE